MAALPDAQGLGAKSSVAENPVAENKEPIAPELLRQRLRSAICDRPQDSDLYVQFAQVLAQLQRWPAAALALWRAAELAPANWRLWLQGAQVAEGLGDRPMAIRAYLRSLQANGNGATCCFRVARLLRELGRDREAADCERWQLPPAIVQEFARLDYPLHWCSVADLPAAQTCWLEPIAPYPPLKAAQMLGPVHPHLDPDTAPQLPPWPRPGVVALPQGRAQISQLGICITTADHQTIQELSSGIAPLQAVSQPPPVRKLPGTAAFLSVRFRPNYWHWMVDCLPRLAWLAEAGFERSAIDWWVFDRLDYPFQFATLERLGIDPDRVVSSDRHPHLQADRLLALPSLGRCTPIADNTFTPQTREFLRREFLPLATAIDPAHCPDRLYITRRNNVQHRRFLNEAEILPLLTQRGFQAVDLDGLSLGHQAALFQRARAIVAPHGAGLTNLAYAEPGATVIELFPPRYVANFFWLVANCSHLNYWALLGRETLPPLPIGDWMAQAQAYRDDLEIDPQALATILDRANL